MSLTIEQLYAQRQASFVEARTITETEVNKFLRSLEGLDMVFQQELQVVQGQTAKDVLPSLWAEPFVLEQYTAERRDLDARIAQAKQVADKLNAEALRCLQE